MKYSNEIVIDLPREKVIELFDNPDNMKFWQKGLVSFEHLEGEAGKAGAKSTLRYQMGKRKVEMTETIIINNLPDVMESTYETKGIYNLQKNSFKDENGKTKWISDAEFRCSGFMKIMALIWGKKAFQKQSCAYMEDFKAFAEGNPPYGN